MLNNDVIQLQWNIDLLWHIGCLQGFDPDPVVGPHDVDVGHCAAGESKEITQGSGGRDSC